MLPSSFTNPLSNPSRRSQQNPPSLPQRLRFPRHLALDDPRLILRRHLAQRTFQAEKLIERNVLDNAEEHASASRAGYVHHRLRISSRDSPADGFGPLYFLLMVTSRLCMISLALSLFKL